MRYVINWVMATVITTSVLLIIGQTIRYFVSSLDLIKHLG